MPNICVTQVKSAKLHPKDDWKNKSPSGPDSAIAREGAGGGALYENLCYLLAGITRMVTFLIIDRWHKIPYETSNE
jgi:hypothetical protein